MTKAFSCNLMSFKTYQKIQNKIANSQQINFQSSIKKKNENPNKKFQKLLQTKLDSEYILKNYEKNHPLNKSYN